MIRRSLIKIVSNAGPALDEKRAAVVVESMLEEIAKQIAIEGKVVLPGVGTLRVRGADGSRVYFSCASRLRLMLAKANEARHLQAED